MAGVATICGDAGLALRAEKRDTEVRHRLTSENMRGYSIIALLCLLAACAQVENGDTGSELLWPETALPVFGDGYPEPGAPCRRVGESPDTIDFLDDAADLIGCLEAWEGRTDYARSVQAREVLRRDGYVLYSVPRR